MSRLLHISASARGADSHSRRFGSQLVAGLQRRRAFEVVERISAIEVAFGEAKTKTGYETWQINTAVHFNEWADLKKEDFAPVVSAFRAFTGTFGCDTCNEMYFVAPDRGKKEALRCGCGTLNLNLLQKGS